MHLPLPSLNRAAGLLWCCALVTSTACLDPNAGRQGSFGAVDAPAADAAADTTQPPPCLSSCDDGNPCTTDTCDEATGLCTSTDAADGTECDDCAVCVSGLCQPLQNTGPNRASECSQDAGCDDGDPCTSDFCSCSQVGGPCGSGGIEVCTCEHIAIADCGPAPLVPECTSEGVTEMIDAISMHGEAIKIGGVATIGPNAECYLSECGDCTAELVLQDAGGMIVELTSQDASTPWSCHAGGCPNVNTCNPMHAGVAYWAWGTLEIGDGDGVPAANDQIPWMRMNVAGWCLQTIKPQGLQGHYEGIIEHGYGYTYPVTLDITKSGGAGYWFALGELIPCIDCTSAPPQVVSGFEVGDGHLTFEAGIPDGWQVHMSTVDLYSDHNTLAGEFYLPDWGPLGKKPGPPSGEPDGDVIIAPAGTITLTRVQNWLPMP